MFTFRTAAIISTLIFLALPLSATANSDIMLAKKMSSTKSPTPSAQQQQPSKVVKERLVREVVLSSGPTTKADGYRVQNNRGETYINRTLKPTELSPVKTNIQFRNSYEFQHNGKKYKNKVVSN